MRGVSNDDDAPESGARGEGDRAPGPWSDKGYNKLALGLAIGVVLGAGIGTVLGNATAGIGVGLALGIAFAMALGYRGGKDDEDD